MEVSVTEKRRRERKSWCHRLDTVAAADEIPSKT